jgi:iron(III) transport system substrate-binding protein
MRTNRRQVLSGAAAGVGAALFANRPTTATPVADASLIPVGGSMTVYCGRNETRARPLLERLAVQLEINMQVRYAATAELAAALLEEGEDSPADLFFVQDGGALGALGAAGRLRPLPAKILGRVEPQFRSRRGDWIGTSARVRALVYNTDNVEQADLPDSVDNLLEPRWTGRIGWAPSHINFIAFITGFRVLRGDEAALAWLTAMLENGTASFDDHRQLVDAVRLGELDAGLVNHYYTYELLAEVGTDAPITNHFFRNQDPGTLFNVAGAGILSHTKNIVQAEALVSAFLSDASQHYFVEDLLEYPLVPGIDAPLDLPSIQELDPPIVDLDALADVDETVTMLTNLGLM